MSNHGTSLFPVSLSPGCHNSVFMHFTTLYNGTTIFSMTNLIYHALKVNPHDRIIDQLTWVVVLVLVC